MQMRRLGKGGLEVSGLGLGCMAMTSLYGPVDEAEAIATVREALDAGANFLDTADAYADGKNEELLARALADGYRAKAVVATKFGNVRTPDGKPAANGKPEYVVEACNKSLARLKIDAIDLYFQHRVDASVPIEDTVGAMKRLVEQGKVRHLGLSEAGPETLRRANAVHPIAALQTEYSVWCRFVEQRHPARLPLARRRLRPLLAARPRHAHRRDQLGRRPRRERPPPRPSALPGREPRARTRGSCGR